jgi:hypothetical protein
MESIYLLETSLNLHHRIQAYIPEGSILRDENPETDSKILLPTTTTNNG